MNSLPRQRRNWVSKHASGVCGVNTVLLKWKQWDDDHCPRCGMTETAEHVWKCKGVGATDIWLSALTALDQWLLPMHTDNNLRLIIITNLTWSSVNLPTVGPRTAVESEQDLIGWQFLIEGVLPQQWVSYQHILPPEKMPINAVRPNGKNCQAHWGNKMYWILDTKRRRHAM